MKSIKDSIFLLSVTPYRDADLIVNLLSSDLGKLSALIYSGRKIGKSSSFLFQPGDLLDIEYQVRQNNDFIRILNIAGKSTLNPARFSYDRFLFHSYLLELISRISQPGNPAEDLYEILLENNLWRWNREDAFFCMGRYIWLLASHGGFGIDYHNCSSCHKSSWQYNAQQEAIFRKQDYRFQLNSGTLLCHSCSPISDREERITPAMLKVMWIFDTHDAGNMDNPGIPDGIMIDVIKCLNQYLLQRFELSPKSLKLFLDSLKPSA